MSYEAVVVFTAKSIERILREGGTSSWRLDRNHARRCDYAVCTRNANAGWVEGNEAHHSAFLLGKIRDVVACAPTPENSESPENRYLIQFSEFARINIPDVWRGDRNPVKYTSLEALVIDPSKLQWEVMPEGNSGAATAADIGAAKQHGVAPLTLAEAKKGLALTFNVAPEAVEITIRG